MKGKIVLKNIGRPKKDDIDTYIDWFCESFGFCNGRDTDNTTSRIVKEIIEEVKRSNGISTDEIARSLDIRPGRVNHHVRGLIESGFLYRDKKRIFIRGGSLKRAVIEMQKDAERTFQDLAEMAEKMDEELRR